MHLVSVLCLTQTAVLWVYYRWLYMMYFTEIYVVYILKLSRYPVCYKWIVILYVVDCHIFCLLLKLMCAINITKYHNIFLCVLQVLIFSQMTTTLDILSDFCYLRKWKFCQLDGRVSIEDRCSQVSQKSDCL